MGIPVPKMGTPVSKMATLVPEMGTPCPENGTPVPENGDPPRMVWTMSAVSRCCLLDGDWHPNSWGEMRVRWKGGGWGQLGPPASTELLLQCQLDRRQAMRGQVRCCCEYTQQAQNKSEQ